MVDRVYSPRRSFDLTPPSGREGDGFGGADQLLEFIETNVKPLVRKTFANVRIVREALFGHSCGGLFVVYALCKERCSFDCYIASSPSVDWNDRAIFKELLLMRQKCTAIDRVC